MTILAVTGLLREARLAAGPGVVTVTGGGDCQRLARQLDAGISDAVSGVISIGIAGGLAPGLTPGACVIATAIIAGDEIFEPDDAWIARMAGRVPGGILATLAGTDVILAEPAEKVALYASTGAIAADMESHVAARFAKRHGIPFAALRAVADCAESRLPHAASAALTPEGGVDYRNVFRSLARRPQQIPALLRTARQSKAAFAALLRCRQALGFALAGPDGG
jgi:adenosylhomocysteine nucleosidase